MPAIRKTRRTPRQAVVMNLRLTIAPSASVRLLSTSPVPTGEYGVWEFYQRFSLSLSARKLARANYRKVLYAIANEAILTTDDSSPPYLDFHHFYVREVQLVRGMREALVIQRSEYGDENF